jgi:nucleoside-diphosphate-sugar epimerase
MISGARGTTHMQIHIVGCGDIGLLVGQRWLAQGGEVVGLVHSSDSVARLQAAAISPMQADLDSPESLYTDKATRPDGEQVYYFAPPPPEGREDSRLRGWLAALAGARPAKIVLISTTGVYGDAAGNWITESSPVAPKADRACRRLDAETALREWCELNKVAFVILRVAGIYGPGKLPRQRLQKGLPVLNVAEAGFTNRIHAHDLASICLAAMQHGRSGEIYNVSDGRPGTMTDYFNAVADHLGLPRPPQISLAEAESQVSAGMLSYLQESRRIDNSKMLTELKVELAYPDLDSGLEACIQSD